MAKKSNSAMWLFKQEPSEYSFADLERDGKTIWSGVKNATARMHLREIKVGDRVLYYHTGKDKAIVGEAVVTAGPTADPASKDEKAVVVEIQAVQSWPHPVSLERIKAASELTDWELVRISRLSVMPVSKSQWLAVKRLRDKVPGEAERGG